MSSGHRSQLSRDIVHTSEQGVSDGDGAAGGHGGVGAGPVQERGRPYLRGVAPMGHHAGATVRSRGPRRLAASFTAASARSPNRTPVEIEDEVVAIRKELEGRPRSRRGDHRVPSRGTPRHQPSGVHDLADPDPARVRHPSAAQVTQELLHPVRHIFQRAAATWGNPGRRRRPSLASSASSTTSSPTTTPSAPIEPSGATPPPTRTPPAPRRPPPTRAHPHQTPTRSDHHHRRRTTARPRT